MFKKKYSLIFVLLILFVLNFQVFVQSYDEAPMLKELVEEGELPPVEQRLPDEPKVVEVKESIGNYGGYLNTPVNTSSHWSPTVLFLKEYLLLMNNYEEFKTIPNIAKDWEYSDNHKTFTLYLREGMKWSDGEPFTTDDIMFWYEEVIQNEELTPVYPSWLKMKGELVELEQIDKYTVVYHLPQSTPNFHHNFDSSSFRGDEDYGFIPSHALKKYHIEFNSEANELAEEEGYDEWYQLFDEKADFWRTYPKDIPVLTPYILKKETETGYIFERNPYYFKVDEEGNQLPYIDEIRGNLYGGDAETGKMMILSGDIDFDHGFFTSVNDYGTIKRQLEDTHKVFMGEDVWSSYCTLHFNQTYGERDEENNIIGDFLRKEKFRQALSLAINREELKEVVFLDQGVPTQETFHPFTPGFKDKWSESYANYSVEKANSLLDEIGLEEKSKNGWRIGPDGEEISLRIVSVDDISSVKDSLELIVDYWKEVGINADMRIVDRSYLYEFVGAGRHQVSAWITTGAGNTPFVTQGSNFNPVNSWAMSRYGNWLTSDGEEGIEPPQDVKKLYDWCQQLLYSDKDTAPNLIEKIGDQWAKKLYSIGTVGYVGRPVVVNEKLKNVGTEILVENSDYPYIPIEQFFWSNSERK